MYYRLMYRMSTFRSLFSKEDLGPDTETFMTAQIDISENISNYPTKVSYEIADNKKGLHL